MVYSCLDPHLLFRYLLLALLEEGISHSNVTLNSNLKYKLMLVVQDQDDQMEIECQISCFDENIHQVSFMRKSGNIIAYYSYVRNIKS